MNKKELQKEIRRRLGEKNAILLAHYYQRDEVQEIADYLGDSLGLSIEASRTDAEIIVFAGVHFMAESAAILSPEKTVLLPRRDAGCPLADMITEGQLAAARVKHPEAAVVTYINSTAAIKAASDICCTSANALQVVRSLPGSGPVLMIPDGNLARFIAGQTGRQIIPWEGFCPVHNRLDGAAVSAVRKMHPDAVFAAHPECAPEVLARADFIGSTTGIIAYAGRPEVKKLIVGTERGVFYRLQSLYPEKTFIPAADDFLCPDMKLTTLEDILNSLVNMQYVAEVPETIRIPARKSLDRMLALA